VFRTGTQRCRKRAFGESVASPREWRTVESDQGDIRPDSEEDKWHASRETTLSSPR